MTQVNALLWFLKRPSLYLELVREIAGRVLLRNDMDQTGEAARAWCAARAVDTETALGRLTGAAGGHVPLRQKFAGVFAAAEARAKACPARMGGPGNLDLLYGLSEYCGATWVLETGVAYGWSSLTILLSAAGRPRHLLVSVDRPYPRRNNDDHVGCAVPRELRGGWRLIRLADREGVPRALQVLGALDLCHYDSDKSYNGRQWAYPLLWRAVRSGGFFISDDIEDNVAFRDFAEALGEDPVVVEWDGKYTDVIVKP
jgi:predicted O-methyltransferase YrrM